MIVIYTNALWLVFYNKLKCHKSQVTTIWDHTFKIITSSPGDPWVNLFVLFEHIMVTS